MRNSKIQNLTRCTLAAALMAVCAWITVPGAVPFTLQTFGLFLTLELLGGRLGTQTVAVYLGLGILGLPVFSGFQGGIGVLMGATGGYLTGFLVGGLIYWTLEKFRCPALPALLAAAVGYYTFGTVWYRILYANGSSLWAVISACVLPFLIPDGIKLALAHGLARRLKPHLHA